MLKSLNLLWSDSDLTIVGPPFPQLEKELSYWHKSLVQEGYRRVTKGETINLFSVVDDIGPVRTIVTFQGFLDDIVKLAITHGYHINLVDKRLPFPKPKYDLMYGFRMSQEELTRQMLDSDQSGLLVAPTRFGKTAIFVNIMRAFPNLRTVMAAPGVDLLDQLVTDLKTLLPDRDIVGLYTGSRNRKPSDDITVCSFDSLQKCDFEGTELLLVDEVQSAVTESRAHLVNRFTKARRLGLSATIEGRYDNADKLIKGIFGPVLAERTYLDAVKEGAICPIVVYLIKVPFEHFDVSRRNTAYNKLMFRNHVFKELVRKLSSEIIHDDWQTLIFVNEEKHADELNKILPDAVIAMQKKMKSKKERQELFTMMKDAEIMRCICSNIYSTGVTFSELRTLINCAGGGGSISSIQKPGRLAEIRPNKKCGYVFDFLFECVTPQSTLNEIDDNVKEWRRVVNDCKSRLKVYREKGYDVRIIEDLHDIVLE